MGPAATALLQEVSGQFVTPVLMEAGFQELQHPHRLKHINTSPAWLSQQPHRARKPHKGQQGAACSIPAAAPPGLLGKAQEGETQTLPNPTAGKAPEKSPWGCTDQEHSTRNRVL